MRNRGSMGAIFIDHGAMFGGDKMDPHTCVAASRYLDRRIYDGISSSFIANLRDLGRGNLLAARSKSLISIRHETTSAPSTRSTRELEPVQLLCLSPHLYADSRLRRTPLAKILPFPYDFAIRSRRRLPTFIRTAPSY
jgi:hypothetical protein